MIVGHVQKMYQRSPAVWTWHRDPDDPKPSLRLGSYFGVDAVEEEPYCEECLKDENKELLLECRGEYCGGVMKHSYCTNPPMLYAPKDGYFTCRACRVYGFTFDDSAAARTSSSQERSAVRMLRWVETTPFGLPVDPEV